MWYALLADLTLLVHLMFVLFVVGGGLLAFRWRRIIFAHLPAAAWGALVEINGWICPLTPLEQWLRHRAQESVNQGDFIGHYLLPVLYPEGLTRNIQIVLGLLVVAVNLVVYGWLLRRKRCDELSNQVGKGEIH